MEYGYTELRFRLTTPGEIDPCKLAKLPAMWFDDADVAKNDAVPLESCAETKQTDLLWLSIHLLPGAKPVKAELLKYTRKQLHPSSNLLPEMTEMGVPL